ncbi:Hypothetical predicted protein, partial [Olea europaea subsp. europaea]
CLTHPIPSYGKPDRPAGISPASVSQPGSQRRQARCSQMHPADAARCTQLMHPAVLRRCTQLMQLEDAAILRQLEAARGSQLFPEDAAIHWQPDAPS